MDTNETTIEPLEGADAPRFDNAPIGVFGLAWCAATGFPLSGIWVFGCGLAGAGLGLFSWFGVLAASKGLVNLTHSFARWVKGLFIKLKRNDASPIAPEGAAHV